MPNAVNDKHKEPLIWHISWHFIKYCHCHCLSFQSHTNKRMIIATAETLFQRPPRPIQCLPRVYCCLTHTITRCWSVRDNCYDTDCLVAICLYITKVWCSLPVCILHLHEWSMVQPAWLYSTSSCLKYGTACLFVFYIFMSEVWCSLPDDILHLHVWSMVWPAWLYSTSILLGCCWHAVCLIVFYIYMPGVWYSLPDFIIHLYTCGMVQLAWRYSTSTCLKYGTACLAVFYTYITRMLLACSLPERIQHLLAWGIVQLAWLYYTSIYMWNGTVCMTVFYIYKPWVWYSLPDCIIHLYTCGIYMPRYDYKFPHLEYSQYVP